MKSDGVTQFRIGSAHNPQALAPSEDVVAKQENSTPSMTTEPQVRPTGFTTSQDNSVPITSAVHSSIDHTSHPSNDGAVGKSSSPSLYDSRTRTEPHTHTQSPSDIPSLHGKMLGNSRPSLSIDISQPHAFPSSETRDLRQRFHSIGSSEDEVALRLTQKLASVLKSSESRKALCKLQGDEAQLMVEYLYRFLPRQPSSTAPWLKKYALVALYKLSKSSLRYPHCYVLKDIEADTSQEGGGAFSDILRGSRGDQHVCLKVIRLFKKSQTDAMLKVYAKEAILWGQLHHPNVVPFYGIYYLNNERRQICLVSPWMRNGNLTLYLRNNPSVSRTLFVHDVAAGLKYLHNQSLIHGDLKGPNVLVNDAKIACITDFGLSSVRTDETLPYTSISTSAHALSHHWTAPELLEDGETVSMSSDVWALGCVFYEVLTRKIPFQGLSDAQVVRKLIGGATPQPPNLLDLKAIPGAVAIWALIQKCWVIEPRGRPTCRTILEALISEGLTRSDDDGTRSTENDMHSRKVRFEQAIKTSQEVPIDYVGVEDILDNISDGNRDAGAELQMNFHSPLSPLLPATVDCDSSSAPRSVWINTPMLEVQRSRSGTLTDFQAISGSNIRNLNPEFFSSSSEDDENSENDGDGSHDDDDDDDDDDEAHDAETHDDEAHDYDDEAYDDYDYDDDYDDYD